MRELGNVKLALMCDRFDVTIKYSIPVKIDLFALHILDIINHGEFNNYKIYDALLGLGVPADLAMIYEKSFKNLLNSPTKLIEFNKYGLRDYETYINNEGIYFKLTENGREALASKELPSKIEQRNFSVVYDYTRNEFIIENKLKKAELDKSIVLSNKKPMDEIMSNEYITREFNDNLYKYLNDSRAKLYDIKYNVTSDFPVPATVKLIEENGELSFTSNNEFVLKAFINAPDNEKRTIKDKMFKYLNLQSMNNDLRKVNICTDESRFKSGFISNENCAFYLINSGFLFDDLEYNIAGLDEKNAPLMIKYNEVNINGYIIPLIEKNRKDSDYKNIYDRYYKNIMLDFVSNLKVSNLEVLLNLTINKDKENVLKESLKVYGGNYRSMMNILDELYEKQNTNPAFKKVIQDFVVNLLKDNISSEKIHIYNLMQIVEKYNIPEEKYFNLIKNCYEMTDDLINILLVKNEKLTMKTFNLIDFYNETLANNTISEHNHNNSLFTDFLNYNKQLQNMSSVGFNSYYDYELPKKDWSNFITEVKRLESLHNRIKLNLTGTNRKGASDFFGSIFDIYYELSPINVSTDPSFDNSGDFLNDMEKAINAKNPQFIGLAATIRHKYSQILHSLELSKDGANQREKRLGYQLISYVIDKKSVDEVYKNWRNLCILVHSDTEKDNDLVKGDDSQRRRALLSALNTYKSKLYPFEKRDE